MSNTETGKVSSENPSVTASLVEGSVPISSSITSNASTQSASKPPTASTASSTATTSTVVTKSKWSRNIQGPAHPVDYSSPEWRCAICHIPSTQQCSLCKEAAYCGKQHQRDDWNSHKLICRGNIPVSDVKCKVIYDYDSKGVRRGRKLIAAKAIKQGEIFLKELPLVWVPKNDIRPKPLKPLTLDEIEFLQNAMADTTTAGGPDNFSSACIVCGGMIIADAEQEQHQCRHCHWPVCSDQCESSPAHSKECKIFQGNHIPRYIQQLLPNRFLFVLRSLLLQNLDPKKWRLLMELEYNPQEMSKKYSPAELFSEDDDGVDGDGNFNLHNRYDIGISKLLRFYGIKCEVEWVSHLMKVIKWNVIYDYEYDSRAMLFHLSSAARHSCIPNSEALFKKSDGRLHFRALTDLSPGETILITRDPLANMLTAQIRQKRLKYLTGWDGFRCKCARCSDWTELNTNFATLQCRKQLENWAENASASEPSPCSGTLSATRPLDQNFEWKCSICKFRVTGDLNQDKLGLKNLLSQVYHQADTDGNFIFEGVTSLESFLYWFHPNHSFIFQTKYRILDTVNLLCVAEFRSGLYDDKVDQISVKGFKDIDTVYALMKYATDCLKTAESIFPGYTRIRGHILQFFGFAKWTCFQLDKISMNTEEGFLQYKDVQLITEAREHLREAGKILWFFKDVKQTEQGMMKFGYQLAQKIDRLLLTLKNEGTSTDKPIKK